MDFQDAVRNVIADLTPQPWAYTTDDNRTLTVIPANLPSDPGCAEVYIRITISNTTASEAAITTTDLPTLIGRLSEPIVEAWEHVPHWPDGTPKGLVGTWCGDDYGLTVAPVGDDGFRVIVAEDTGDTIGLAAAILPEEQRLPLASALARALDVARGWEE